MDSTDTHGSSFLGLIYSQFQLVALSLFLSFIVIDGISQTSSSVRVEWGDSYEASGKFYAIKAIIGSDSGGIYTVDSKRTVKFPERKFVLNKYDLQQNLIKSNQIFPIEHIDYKFENAIQLGEQFFVLSSYPDSKQKQNNLYAQWINKETLELHPNRELIASIAFSDNNTKDKGSFNVKLSKDKSKLLILCNPPYDSKLKEKFEAFVFDTKFQLLWQSTLELKYNEELFSLKDFLIDNNGDVFFLGKLYRDKKENKRKGKPNYDYKILKYSMSLERLQEYEIKLTDKYLNNLKFTTTKDKLICGGYYSENKPEQTLGNYFIKLSKENLTIETSNSNQYSIDDILKYKDLDYRYQKMLKHKKGKKVEMKGYKLNRIIITPDQGMISIGEQASISSISSVTPVNPSMPGSSSGGTSSTSYAYRNLLITKVSKSGSVEWVHKIPKAQVSKDDFGLYSSFFHVYQDNRLHIIYNDTEKNADLKEDETPYMSLNRAPNNSKYKVYLISIDNSGNLSKESIIDVNNSGVAMCPRAAKTMTNSEILLFGKDKAEHRLSKIILKP